jgi:hypothetical protein
MNKRTLLPSVLIVALIAVVLCILYYREWFGPSGHPSPLTISLSGPAGTSFTGYYVASGRRVAITNVLPWMLTATNLSECEFRKTDTNSAIVLDLRGEGLQLVAPASGVRDLGVRATLDGGWSFQVVR